MKEVHLTEDDIDQSFDPDEFAGKKLDDRHYDRLFGQDGESVKIYKPDGGLLAVLLKDAIDRDKCLDAYKSLRKAAVEGGKNKGNRAMATGKDSRKRRVKNDGSISNTLDVPKEMSPNTGIVGYFDRYPRIPYCRQTKYNVNNPEKWAKAVPFFQRCDELFEEYVPERYSNQKEKAEETVDDWLIPDTAFTTVTVNLNWQTACHTDRGDYKPGFGVMPVISLGDYEGAYFIQPKFRNAFDLRTGDLLLNEVHEWHGNGPFHETQGYYERLSVVLYYRREMDKCGTPEEERERAKKLRD